MEGEPRPRHPGEDDGQPLPGEIPAHAEIAPGQARRIIEDGITAAEHAGAAIDDWVAGHVARQLKTEDSSALDVLVQSGEITEDLQPELMRAYLKAEPRRRWIGALYGYLTNRPDRGPVDGWEQQARLRDWFHTVWWDRDRQRGNRYTEGRELDREVRNAQDAREVITDELVLRLLVRIASSPHSAVARFAADSRVTDELSQELQEKYLSGTEQERRWLNELGTWITANGQPSPVPWWRSPVPVAQPMADEPDSTEQAERRAARLADLEERLAPLPDLGDIPRPPQWHGVGDGYDWMTEGLPHGWHAEPIWGRDGWNLGVWPLVIVALYADDERENYAVATYVEGDVDVKRYQSRGALYVAVNGIAEFYWRHGESRGPRDLPEGSGLLAHHTGPYPGWSEAREAEVEQHPERRQDDRDA